ncbi:GNAT family N-acetyltransferase [Paenibacillus sp. NPDC056579]|uniref:GNAT family N-acetyltransferase n=1 Tax=Paenibacillus sp. NPDC056579 TaxID=3345871 RepID=UPI0036AB2ED9
MIDSYIRTHYLARRDHSLGIASTTVVYFNKEVAAFFTACCTRVGIPEEESRILGLSNLFVPAIEVKFIAVREDLQGNGIGSAILKTIIADAYFFSEKFACRYIFLWSVPDPRSLKFYKDNFFEETGLVNSDGLHMMMLRLPEDIDEDEY